MFKYVLLRLSASGGGGSRLLVRGRGGLQWHQDNLDAARRELLPLLPGAQVAPSHRLWCMAGSLAGSPHGRCPCACKHNHVIHTDIRVDCQMARMYTSDAIMHAEDACRGSMFVRMQAPGSLRAP